MEALLPSSISPKMSAILQSHVYPRVGRVLRALARFKSMVLDALGKTTKRVDASRRKKKHAISYRSRSSSSSSRKRSKQVATTSGFIMKPPLAWSGGLSPSRAAALDASYHVYPSLESAWNAVVPAPSGVAGGGENGTAAAAAEYCGYLRWLEEEMPDDGVPVVEEEEEEEEDVVGGGNEIDRLAEKFIARCRARFLLEKQESYDRRCQEMIARSM